MSEIRFGWLGESRRTALCTLLTDEVADWSREWWVHHSSDAVSVQALDSLGLDVGQTPFVAVDEAGTLAIFLRGRTLDDLGRYFAGVADEETAGWAHCIGEDSLRDLVTRIHRRAGDTGTVTDLRRVAASPELIRNDLGGCMVAVALGRLQLVVVVDRRLGARLVPPQTGAGMDLVPRRVALNGVPLCVDAIIDFGLVSLTHLSDLRVGEILVGERGLEEPLGIRVEGHGVVATAYLRRLGAQRAVMLDGVNSQDK